MVHYMRVKNIQHDLQLKVRSFFYFLWHENQIRNETAEEKVLQKLPKKLRNRLWYDDYKKYTASVQIFADLPQHSFVGMLEQVAEMRYGPGDTIADVVNFTSSAIFLDKAAYFDRNWKICCLLAETMVQGG